MVEMPQSNGTSANTSVQGTALGIVMGLGKLLVVLPLFYLATHVSFGTPCVVPVAVLFCAVGLVCVVSASRTAGMSWTDSIMQAPHYCAAFAGAIFLFVVISRTVRHQGVLLSPTRTLSLLSLLALGTWWRRKRGLDENTSGAIGAGSVATPPRKEIREQPVGERPARDFLKLVGAGVLVAGSAISGIVLAAHYQVDLDVYFRKYLPWLLLVVSLIIVLYNFYRRSRQAKGHGAQD